MSDMTLPVSNWGGQWPNLKACDNGDGTFSVAVAVLTNPDNTINNYRNIVGASTTVVKTGSGILQSIICNKAIALSTTTIYDNTAGSGTKIGTITQPISVLLSQFVQNFNCGFTTGLTIVTSAADDITVVYQ